MVNESPVAQANFYDEICEGSDGVIQAIVNIVHSVKVWGLMSLGERTKQEGQQTKVALKMRISDTNRGVW